MAFSFADANDFFRYLLTDTPDATLRANIGVEKITLFSSFMRVQKPGCFPSLLVKNGVSQLASPLTPIDDSFPPEHAHGVVSMERIQNPEFPSRRDKIN